VTEDARVRVQAVVNVAMAVGLLAFALHLATRGVVVLDGRRYAGPALGFLAGVPASLGWYALRAAQIFVRREVPVPRRPPGRLIGIDPRQRGEVLVRTWVPLLVLVTCALAAFALSDGS
jgi:hypothetical protein